MAIPAELLKALNNQVTIEFQAAYVYMQLAYEMDRLALVGIRDWFKIQAAEERVHAEKFAAHILDRDERIELHNVDISTLTVDSALEAFEIALAHEQKVSAEIREIARISDAEKDYDSRTLINWFLSEQIEEESTVSEIIDRLKFIGKDGSGVLRLDAELGTRSAQAQDQGA